MAFGAYKMSKRDADRIQEHTGVDPEELDDHELEQAMTELGIDKQTVSAEDREEGSGAPQAEAESAPSSGSPTDLDQLEKLGDLHAAGILTDEEFEAKKKQILGP